MFNQYERGGIDRYFTITPVLDSVSEGRETILLEVSAGDWPFTIRENTTILTINECSTRTGIRFNSIYGCIII